MYKFSFIVLLSLLATRVFSQNKVVPTIVISMPGSPQGCFGPDWPEGPSVTVTSTKIHGRVYKFTAVIAAPGGEICGPTTPLWNPCYRPDNTLADLSIELEKEQILTDIHASGDRHTYKRVFDTLMFHQVYKNRKNTFGVNVIDTSYAPGRETKYIGEFHYKDTLVLWRKVKLHKKQIYVNGSVCYNVVGRNVQLIRFVANVEDSSVTYKK